MAFKSLFAPIQVGDITLKNRITMAALTRNRAENTIPTELMKEYYVQRADAGLIVTEGNLIVRQGSEWPHAPGIWDDEQVAGWKNIIDGVHAVGGKIYTQLWHLGRASHPEAEQQKLAGIPVYAPSAVSARGGKFRTIPGQPGFTTPTELEDPWTIIQQFKQAAINAKQAGFDGVELHGANGYLVHQFLDTTSNFRTDQWGGSIENRSRFGLETLKVLIEVFGRNVGIKLSPAGGYNDMGMPLQETIETYSYFIAEADKLDLAYISLMRYSSYLDVEYEPGVKRGTVHDVLKTYKPFIKKAKFFINVDVTPEEGEKLVLSGKVDAISIGTNFITHPDLVKRVEHGKPLDNVLDDLHMQTNKDSGDWATGYTDYPTAVY